MPLNLKPVIVLAFANDHSGNESYLNLKRERNGIEQMLLNARQNSWCDLVIEPDATADDIFALFNRADLKERIVAFHYAGHAGKQGLHLQTDGVANKIATAEGMAQLMKSQPLQLVFLNGCLTQNQYTELQKANIPNIIYTNQSIEDNAATDFAIHFYEALGNNRSIADSFSNAEAYVKTHSGTDPKRFIIELLDEQDKPVETDIPTGKFPWELWGIKTDWTIAGSSNLTGAKPQMKVFFAYAPEDAKEASELQKHIKLLQRQKYIETSDLQQIGAGSEISKELKSHLFNAQIILLGVSANFLASDQCFEIQEIAMQRHNDKRAIVIPILLKYTQLDGLEFTKLQGLPRNNGFISSACDKDKEYTDIATELRKIVDDYIKK